MCGVAEAKRQDGYHPRASGWSRSADTLSLGFWPLELWEDESELLETLSFQVPVATALGDGYEVSGESQRGGAAGWETADTSIRWLAV